MNQEKKKILVIEDQKPLSHALELKLSHEGFDVISRGNGENLLPLLQSENFSLIICDLVMPKVDGFEVLEILKKNDIKIPIAILTNLSQAEDEKRVRAYPQTDFFIKSNTPLASIVEYAKKTIGE